MNEPVFAKVGSEIDFPKEEEAVLSFWKSRRIFEKSLEQRKGAKTFVFYEGPPTANGLPHNGHVLTRVVKDLFPRYKTMRGYRVPRKAGWDTHGLPVEVEVEKELRIHGKAAIKEYGVEPFAAKCIESVFRYTKEWESLTERIAFWCDLDDAYVTYHQSYVESVWWALSELFKKGLLYQGHKVVWWWAQGGTALSSAEVGLGYKSVDDPSVFVAFPLVSEPDVSLLVWTTTPWTLPSNMYAAVHPDFEYAVVQSADRKLIVAAALVESLSKKLGTELTVLSTRKGSELAGLEYRPPFSLYEGKQHRVARKSSGDQPAYFRVIAADFVLSDASGIVHVAPAFGEDDHNAHKKELSLLEDPSTTELLCAIRDDGTFLPEVPRYGGRWVKDCDREIARELSERGLLLHSEVYRHDYPFCWRSDSDPLIQYARPAWYIRTTEVKDRAIANNRAVHWLPDHIKEGRFGDFLANNVDWALSRERFWGTPLNIWVNDTTGAMQAPASMAEILEKNPRAFDHFEAARASDPSLSPHLAVHKPWIDSVTFTEPGEPGVYRRVPEVIDCWFDSGCMPFAQWGYPHQGQAEFREAFPADFISEAIDQTRGWFYSLLMISTLVFDDECRKRHGLPTLEEQGSLAHPYRTCIVLGHVCDKEGKKESKSKGNYTPPEVILDRVRMDFAVLEGPDAKPGIALIAREDLEGLDLLEGAKVRLYRPDASETAIVVELRAHKKLPRRVVVLSAEERAKLGVSPTSIKDVKPVEVPRLPLSERVTVEDPASPAPGSDAFRWFFYASNPPWNNTRHSLSNVRSLQKDFAVKLRNVFSFFVIYANIDAFDPYSPENAGVANVAERPELDRWILSELALANQSMVRKLDDYDVYGAASELVAVVEGLSNWYVRRSRARFWRGGWDADKRAAYVTLWEVLTTLAKLSAPFTPFQAETIYQNLVCGPAGRRSVTVPESVHLCDYPEASVSHIDDKLSRKVATVRALVSLGLQVRTEAKLRVRQPLRAAHVAVSSPEVFDSSARAMLLEELNIESLEVYGPTEATRFVTYKIAPNFRTLGQKGLGKEAQALKKRMATMPSDEISTLVNTMLATGRSELDGVLLEQADVTLELVSKPGFAAASDRIGVVVLETTIDERLRDRGLARELKNAIQGRRKELALEFTDRIGVRLFGSERLARVAGAFGGEISEDVLAVSLSTEPEAAAPEGAEWLDFDGEKIGYFVVRA